MPNAAMLPTSSRSKAFLLGLYIGLSLLVLFSYFDPNGDSGLHVATNVYGLQALAGAVLGFWRMRKARVSVKTPPALASFLICVGLAFWAIAQGAWVGSILIWHNHRPYPGPADMFYIPSDLCWLVALYCILKALRGFVLPAIRSYAAVLYTITAAFVVLFGWVDRYLIRQAGDGGTTNIPHPFPTLATDIVYIAVAFTSVLVALALLLRDNTQIPYPLHQCIRYLALATAIDAVAIIAFTVTDKFGDTNALAYSNGNWVDWLFLTAMYFWGVSALRCPIRQEELKYTFGTTLSGLREADVYQAGEMAVQYCSKDETERVATYTNSIRWILDNIPDCWRVIKLGDLVVGSTLLFPVPEPLIGTLLKGKITERQMFEQVKRNTLTWDYLYLADASILTKHRRRGLAYKSFKETIEFAKSRNKEIKVFCRPNTDEEKGLEAKLQNSLPAITFEKFEGTDVNNSTTPE